MTLVQIFLQWHWQNLNVIQLESHCAHNLYLTATSDQAWRLQSQCQNLTDLFRGGQLARPATWPNLTERVSWGWQAGMLPELENMMGCCHWQSGTVRCHRTSTILPILGHDHESSRHHLESCHPEKSLLIPSYPYVLYIPFLLGITKDWWGYPELSLEYFWHIRLLNACLGRK